MWACKIYFNASKSAKSPTQTPKEKKRIEKKKKREFKMNVYVIIIFVQFGWRLILIAGSVPSSFKPVKFTK